MTAQRGDFERPPAIEFPSVPRYATPLTAAGGAAIGLGVVQIVLPGPAWLPWLGIVSLLLGVAMWSWAEWAASYTRRDRKRIAAIMAEREEER